MIQVSYYPGCSLTGTANDYAASIERLCTALEIELCEVPDWNCCGATAAHSINHRAAIDLAGRTLNQASRLPNQDLLVPCPMCFNRLKTAAVALRGENSARYDTHLQDNLPTIWDLADFFATQKMLTALGSKIRKPLEGLKVVCYYGCMANRPPDITETKNFEDPDSMDRSMDALGATAVAWPYKTDCCGAGGQALARPDMMVRMVGKLLDMAERTGAQAVVVSCQMCQANLDMYQTRVGDHWGRDFQMPIFYFSELMGLALELTGTKKGLARHITDPLSLVQDLGF